MSQLLKSSLRPLFAGAIMLTIAGSALAKTADQDAIEISSKLPTSKEEIAVIQVLSEICPQIIGKNKNFDSGYKKLLADNLTGFADPELALKALNEEADYQPILKQARNDAANATREENREVCLGVIELNKKK